MPRPSTTFPHCTIHFSPTVRTGITCYPNCLIVRAPGSTVRSQGGTQSMLPGMPPPKPRTPSSTKHKGVTCEVCAEILGSTTGSCKATSCISSKCTRAWAKFRSTSSRRACERGNGRRFFRRGELLRATAKVALLLGACTTSTRALLNRP